MGRPAGGGVLGACRQMALDPPLRRAQRLRRQQPAAPDRRGAGRGRTCRRAHGPAPASPPRARRRRRRSRGRGAAAARAGRGRRRSARRPRTAAGSRAPRGPAKLTATGRRQTTRYAGEVVEREVAAAVADGGDHRPRPLAAVESAAAPRRGDRLEACRRDRAAAAGRPRRAACPSGSSRCAPLVAVAKDRVEQAVDVRLGPGELDPLARQLDRRLEQLRQGSRPYARCAASSPATAPGTATDAGPIRNGCVVGLSPKPTSTASISAARAADVRPRPGAATKKSASRAVGRGRDGRA